MELLLLAGQTPALSELSLLVNTHMHELAGVLKVRLCLSFPLPLQCTSPGHLEPRSTRAP